MSVGTDGLARRDGDGPGEGGKEGAHVGATRPRMVFPPEGRGTEGDHFGVEMIERHEEMRRRRFPSRHRGILRLALACVA